MTTDPTAPTPAAPPAAPDPAGSPAALPLRRVTVTAVRSVTPRMVRVTLGDPSLAGVPLAGPDRQVKLFFPRPGQAGPVLPAPDPGGDVVRWYAAYGAIPEGERPWMRSYTLRHHDPVAATVDVDFLLHEGTNGTTGGEGGPATRWARSARVGDVLGMFGPSDAFAPPVDPGAGDWALLVADACALPALATLVAALPPDHQALAYVQVADAGERQPLPTAGRLTVHWLHGDASLEDAVRTAAFPAGRPYAWLAGEAATVRALRRHLVEERGIERRAVDFAGYWRRRLTQDDAPTPDDLAEARERLALRDEG